MAGPLPEGFGRSSCHPLPPLHYNRLVVHVSLSSTLTPSLITALKRVARTSLRCSVGILFSAFLGPAVSFSCLQSCPLQDGEQHGPLFPKTFPSSVSPNWFSDIASLKLCFLTWKDWFWGDPKNNCIRLDLAQPQSSLFPGSERGASCVSVHS